MREDERVKRERMESQRRKNTSEKKTMSFIPQEVFTLTSLLAWQPIILSRSWRLLKSVPSLHWFELVIFVTAGILFGSPAHSPAVQLIL